MNGAVNTFGQNPKQIIDPTDSHFIKKRATDSYISLKDRKESSSKRQLTINSNILINDELNTPITKCQGQSPTNAETRENRIKDGDSRQGTSVDHANSKSARPTIKQGSFFHKEAKGMLDVMSPATKTLKCSSKMKIWTFEVLIQLSELYGEIGDKCQLAVELVDPRGMCIKLESRNSNQTKENGNSEVKLQQANRKINQSRKVFAFDKFDTRPSYCRIRMEKMGWLCGLRIINVNLTRETAAIKKLYIIISKIKYRVPDEYLKEEIKDLKKSYIPVSVLEPCVRVPDAKLLAKEELLENFFKVILFVFLKN